MAAPARRGGGASGPAGSALVIFDLDGLLVDSEPLHCRAYLAVFHRHGIAMDEDTYYLRLTTRGTPIQTLCREAGIATPPEVIVEEKAEIYLRLIDEEMEMMPGARPMLARLRARYATALASASRRAFIDRIVARFALGGEFDAIVTSSEVPRRKPHPDIFLRTAGLLGFSPRDCAVIEDSEKGVTAAHAAGMASVAVPSRYTRGGDFSKATAIVGSLDEVTPELIERVLRR